MVQRIEVTSKVSDSMAGMKSRRLREFGFGEDVSVVGVTDVYTVDEALADDEFRRTASMLSNPVSQDVVVGNAEPPEGFDWAVEVGGLPGVTDNVGATAREGVEDLLGVELSGQAVYSSELMFLSGELSREDAYRAAEIAANANPLIQRIDVMSRAEFEERGGMPAVVPRVKLDAEPKAGLVDILSADDNELRRIGKAGIFDYNEELTRQKYVELREAFKGDELKLGDTFEEDGKFFQKVRRGPLALGLADMKIAQQYFAGEGRNPFDVELESIAQTQSEHCKHRIFAGPMDDDVPRGLYETYIKGATVEIRKRRGKDDICVSVFSDNAGIIRFDEKHNITLKVETHNKPSGLDPKGGAGTGIVGVIRDPIGTGLGSGPFLNLSGPFCFGNPDNESLLYKGENFTQKMLSSRQTLDGVVDGVQVGGNCSGIPTSHSRLVFNDRYNGVPIVYVGCFGVMPVESAGRPSHEKSAMVGDYIVMTGGRVGKDGIHGATFSSEAMDSGSPSTAVQIMDPITQKKMSDALMEIRDFGWYTSITDNGAGGLSCSVAEMAKESGGCRVNLGKVPLKYPGLAPWQTWISESQERMTLSVPPKHWDEFSSLMKRRGVEATVIGEFTDSGRCVVDYNGERVVDLDMDFLHDGMPPRPMKTTYTRLRHEEPDFSVLENLTDSLLSMLGRKNVASIEFISKQFDHEVQGGSVLKPLQGKGRVNGDATVTRPVLDSRKGVVVAQGINPSFSDIDTYHMAACAIDSAIRGAVAAGGNLEHMALLDNFCWCSSGESERLGQLKEATRACYDYAVGYGTPFVSGKDSMFNDFKGYNERGEPVKISIPPTLLITAVSVMDDSRKAVSLDAKVAGDLVYVLGDTDDELGGSEYFAMVGEQQRGRGYVGNKVPKVDCEKNRKLYGALARAIDDGVVASAQSVGIGGLGVALAKTAMGGQLGMDVDLVEVPIVHESGCGAWDDYLLFSESQGRFVVTIDPSYKSKFEGIIRESGSRCKKIGEVTSDDRFVIRRDMGSVYSEPVNTSVRELTKSYKATFKDY